MKKTISIMITIIVVFSLLSVVHLPVSAEEVTKDDLTFEINDGKAVLWRCNDSASGVITIPSVVNGYLVTGINWDAFYYCKNITGVYIPSSISSISEDGTNLFYLCSALESITVDPENPYYCSINNCLIKTSSKTLHSGCKNSVIPDDGSVTNIRGGAFEGCEGLKSMTIPACITSIDLFGLTSGCSSLESISVSEGNPRYHSAGNCLIETSTKTLIAGCKNSVIPDDDSVTSIYRNAFSRCIGLTSIIIPDSVSSIGDNAFSECSGLTGVILSENVNELGQYAFYGCNNLSEISIPSSISNIGSGSFSQCKNLKNLIISNGVTTICVGAFLGCDGLSKVVIPNSVITIEDQSFSLCGNLSEVTIPLSVKTIGQGAFINCPKLANIYYQGSKSDRDKISISPYDNSSLLNATWHYNSFADPDVPDNPNNPTANARIRVKSDSVLRNTNVTIIAKATGVPEGYVLAVYDGGLNPVVIGNKDSVKYEIPEEVKSDKTLTVKVIDTNKNVQKDANGYDLSEKIEIKVKTGFLNAIIAFFKKLFRSNTIIIEP